MFEAWGRAMYRGRRLYAGHGIAERDDGPAAAKGTVPVPAARGQ